MKIKQELRIGFSFFKFGNTPQKIPNETGWPDWKELLRFWETQLVILAKEFMEGKLIIDPLKEDETCKNCGYQTLCRIGEVGSHYENEEIYKPSLTNYLWTAHSYYPIALRMWKNRRDSWDSYAF